MILLDTNAVIAALNDRPPRVGDTIAKRIKAGARVGVSSVVIFELWYGIAKSARRRDNALQLQRFLSSTVELVPFDQDDAMEAGKLRQALAGKGTPIGPYDLLIAGQALRHGATLVTANNREFKRVAGLKVEDWAKG